MVTQFSFFPTPYPDEILHSVLCRYHACCGTPAFVSTTKVLWGQKANINPYLPQALGRIAQRIPAETGLTAYYFAMHNTIYPLLKPLIPEERGQRVLRLLESGQQEDELAILLSGFATSKGPRWQFFRYCEDCWRDDIRNYGEPYWHRLHLLPGVLVCPIHGKSIQNSRAYLKDVSTNYDLASFALASNETAPRYSDNAADMLGKLAGDAAWVMQHGETLPSSERMHELFDQLLQFKGFRSGARTKGKELHAALIWYYGQEILAALQAVPDDLAPWSQLVVQKKKRLLYPIYYLLLMRFLAGSAEGFYTEKHGLIYSNGNDACYSVRNDAVKATQKSVEPLEYREIFLQAIQDNPDCSRGFLIKYYPKVYCWLRANDTDWYEANAPASKMYDPADWTTRDEETLQKAINAVNYLRNLPGRPTWITRRSVEKYGGIELYQSLADGKLPKTKAYLDVAIENNEEWGKRKIQWAVKSMVDGGERLLLQQIRKRASISHKYFEFLIPFTLNCIEEMQK